MQVSPVIALLFFPGGLFLLAAGLMYEWAHRKLLARMQNRVGPRWFQPAADAVKLLAKQEIAAEGVHYGFFVAIPIIVLAGVLTAGLYVPLFGMAPAYSFEGDLIVTIYMMSLMTLCLGLAGLNVRSRFTVMGAARVLTQLFAYEVPFLLALLVPAVAAGSWEIGEIVRFTGTQWLLLVYPIGFVAALISLMGKLELQPFDAPEAETEIVAGALTEYSGRGLALFRLAKGAELVLGLALIAAFYLGSVGTLAAFALKTGALLLLITGVQALMARLRIDQTVGLWWRYGILLVLVQWAGMILLEVLLSM